MQLKDARKKFGRKKWVRMLKYLKDVNVTEGDVPDDKIRNAYGKLNSHEEEK